MSISFCFKVNLNIYLYNFSHNIKKVDKELEKYLTDPNEKNIHDIRTSLRRLEAASISSPKQMRKKNLKDFADVGKQLFKINSEIRDIDIILEKLSNEGKTPIEQFEMFENSLKTDRKAKIDNARLCALKLKDINIPKIKDKDNDQDLEDKIIKRLNKTIRKFSKRMIKNIPIVIAYIEKAEELHELRKDSKKMRYLLELLIEKDKKKSDKDTDDNNGISNINDQKILQTIEILEQIQSMLGDIHDYDITLHYIKEQKEVPIDRLVLENVIAIRKKKYEEFVDYFKTDLLVKDNILYDVIMHKRIFSHN